MKSIENKLKNDATKYAVKPSIDNHSKIMQQIKEIEPNKQRPSIKWYYPFLATASVLAFILVFTFMLNDNQVITPSENLLVSPKTTIKADIDMNLIVKNLNINIVNEIDQEHQAIFEDLKYIKSLVVL